MKRKKTNVILIAIVLSLTAVLTTQAKAATTFYEVWRSYDDANPEISEYIGLSENNSLYDYSPQVGSYTTYWVRACKGRVFETSWFCLDDPEYAIQARLIFTCPERVTKDNNKPYPPFRIQIEVDNQSGQTATPQYTYEITVFEVDNGGNDYLIGPLEVTVPSGGSGKKIVYDITFHRDLWALVGFMDGDIAEVKATMKQKNTEFNPVETSIIQIGGFTSGEYPGPNIISANGSIAQTHINWEADGFTTDSELGNPKTIIIPNTPPLDSPANESNISGSEITLRWNEATGATKYHLQLSKEQSFVDSSQILYDSEFGNIHSLIIKNLPDDGTTYYWRVKAGNEDCWGSYSAIWSVINGYPNPPVPPPDFYTPKKASNHIGGFIHFLWVGINGAFNYRIQVADNPNFNPCYNDSDSVGDYPGVYIANPWPNDGTKYYWRVKAQNDAGWGDWSETWFFYNRSPIYVDSTKPDGGDGASWENAYNNLQEAMTVCNGGEELLVADGDYSGLNNTSLSFNGKAIAIRSTNGPDNCVIDGENVNNGFVFTQGEDSNSIIEGFSFRNMHGILKNLNGNRYMGGGIYCKNSSPLIKSCYFENCVSVDDAITSPGFGGAILLWNSDSVIENCTFTGNTSDNGGALFLFGSGNPCFKNCLFKNNTASAIFSGLYPQSILTIENCTFQNNWADEGGAIGTMAMGGKLEVYNCTFENNRSTGLGGAISFADSFILKSCIFLANSAGDEGGAIGIGGGNFTIHNSSFIGNTSQTGGAIYLNDFSTADLLIENCSSAGNQATLGSFFGHADSSSSNILIRNCIVRDGNNGISDPSNNKVTANYNNIQGGWTGPGTGNIADDPCFVSWPYDGGNGWGNDPVTTDIDESENDYYGYLHLKSSSPCIDAGYSDPAFNDHSFPPAMGLITNDMGAFGGPYNYYYLEQPNPQLTCNIEKTITDGVTKYIVTAKLKNNGAPGDHGGVTISFPDLTEESLENNYYSSAIADVNIYTGSTFYPSGINFYDKDDLIYYGTEHTPMLSQHLMFESDCQIWPSANEKTLKLVVTPKISGELTMLIRGWICKGGDNGYGYPVYSDPAYNQDSCQLDQQGFWARTLQIYTCSENPDMTNDGKVNFRDFAILASYWLSCDGTCLTSCCNGADLNSDEIVDFDDLGILAYNWLFSSLTEGLIAYYPFDGNNDDIIGGHGGVWNGGDFVTDGIKGQAYNFSNSIYFTAGTIPEIDNVNQLTVAIWFKGRNTYWGGAETVVCKGNYTEAPAFQLWFSGEDNPQLYNIQINAVGSEYNSTEPYYVDNLLQWHHYALVYDGNKAKAYVDGLVVDETTADIGYINTTGHSLYINRHTWLSSGSSSRLEGQVDEFRVYNRALSDLEIRQLYRLE